MKFLAELRNRDVELKANWHRVKKEEGIEATNLKVSAKRNPIIDVDPFGPPLLTNPKKKPNLALPPPTEITHQKETTSVKKEMKNIENVETRKSFEENSETQSRPTTVKPKSRNRRPKSKSKSPKRVHISSNPKDLPTLGSDNNFAIRESFNLKEEIGYDDSFSDEDVLNLLD